MNPLHRPLILFAAVIALLFSGQFVLGEYGQLSFTRIMVLGLYAAGFNLLYGYTGLMSLGHAMLFAAGLYPAALGVTLLGLGPIQAFLFAIFCGAIFSGLVGAVALRAKGVGFMIVTLMFSQAFYLTILYFGDITRGDEGIVIQEALRKASLFGFDLDLASLTVRYNIAVVLTALVLAGLFVLVRSPFGRVLVAIRENEDRTAMLGYDVARHKWLAFFLSGTLSALSGATYALFFGFAGANFAAISQSIHPILWTLVGGAATLFGPLLGTAIMTVAIDLASEYTTANLFAIGVILILIVLFFPKGILGTLREKLWGWLP